MNATSRAPSTALVRVLFVEDDPSDQRLVADLLDAVPAIRFVIDWARSLAEGRDRLAHGDYDVCLLDLRLPDGDGLDFLASVDLTRPALPVVVLTGLVEGTADRQALHLGAAAFLEKDKLDPATLERTLRYAIHHRKLTAGIARQAFLDDATGLIRSGLYRERLERALAFARRRDRDVAVILIDLAVERGIEEGGTLMDATLRTAGARLADHLRETDSIARLSERRLGLLVEGMRSLHHAASVARKTLRLLRAPLEIDGETITLQPSIGVAIYPREGGDGATLLRQAEAAMRQAITDGGGCCRFGSERIDQEARAEMVLEKAFLLAFEHRALRLRFHPTIGLHGRPNTLAAEIAWKHPDRGWLALDPVLADTDDITLVKGLADWSLASAAEQILAWQREGLSPPGLSLTLPFRRRPALVQLQNAVREQVAGRKLTTDRIGLDLRMELVVDDIARGGSDLAGLKATGIRLALDGFGQGRIAVGDLRRDLLDGLKLAPELCQHLPGDENNARLVRALVHLGHDLGFEVTAKGARDQRQFAVLKRLGCDGVQLAADLPPMTADAATAWLLAMAKPRIEPNAMRPAAPEILVPRKPKGRRQPMDSPPPGARD